MRMHNAQCAMWNQRSAMSMQILSKSIRITHLPSHTGMLPIVGGLLDICPLSFWYQLQTCEITWNTPAEFSSYLPANDVWNGPLGTSLFLNTFSMHRHLQNTCGLYLNRLRNCYTCTLDSSVLSTMQLQRMARKQQPLWKSDHVLASDGI